MITVVGKKVMSLLLFFFWGGEGAGGEGWDRVSDVFLHGWGLMLIQCLLKLMQITMCTPHLSSILVIQFIPLNKS